MSVGENLKRIRESRGLSQMELARQVGVSGPMITQIERGTKNPSLQVSAEIVKVLECRLEDLLDSWKAPEPPGETGEIDAPRKNN